MTETSPSHLPPALSPAKSTLQLVPELTPEHADEEPNVWRTVAIGYCVGFAAVAAAITVAGTMAGLGFVASLGFGVFVGVWGGGGFGFMLAGTVGLAHQYDQPRGAPTNRQQGDQ